MRTSLVGSYLLAALLGSCSPLATGKSTGKDRAALTNSTGAHHSTMKIQMNIGGTLITATLTDGAAARDFASMMPLVVTLKDYASSEKIADLPKRLSTEGEPAGSKPSAGDIAYYAPWGNLAIFYRDASFANGLIRLGRIDTGADALRSADGKEVRIELVDH